MTQASSPGTGSRPAPGPALATSRAAALISACHPGPTLAVTLLATAYAGSVGLAPGRVVLVAGAVLAGQLSIGWCNDLVDRDRDRAVSRTDKPLVTGAATVRSVRVACGVALVVAVVLSWATGLVAGLVHLLAVAGGWAYDLGLKSTIFSWLPYAVAFGALPVFVTLAEPGAGPPPAWVPVAGALLGIGAHLVNIVPDLADDAATGVRGLGHRLGARRATLGAVLALATATAVIALGATGAPPVVLATGLLAVAALLLVALLGRGRTAFRAAIGIAAVDVLLLVVAR